MQCEGVPATVWVHCDGWGRDVCGSRVWIECELRSVLKTFVVKVVEGNSDAGGSEQGVFGDDGEVDWCINVDEGETVTNGTGEQR